MLWKHKVRVRVCVALFHMVQNLLGNQWHAKLRKLSHCFGRCHIQFACRTVACWPVELSLLLICGRCWCSICQQFWDKAPFSHMVSPLPGLQSKQVKWINKFIIANLISVIISIICLSGEQWKLQIKPQFKT